MKAKKNKKLFLGTDGRQGIVPLYIFGSLRKATEPPGATPAASVAGSCKGRQAQARVKEQRGKVPRFPIAVWRFPAIIFEAVAENQPTNKNRVNTELSTFAARLGHVASWVAEDHGFNELAMELFALQFKYNPAYRMICEARGITPKGLNDWTQVPFVPTAAFKELELSCIPPGERTAVFHSSGTTEQRPSRHFHCAESLKVYEESLWMWFGENVTGRNPDFNLVVLTPLPRLAPNSSLIHMFETVRRALGAPESVFVGKMSPDGTWILDFDRTVASLDGDKPKLILGTAFSYVHLLDYLAEKNIRFQLASGSRTMETGGYKNRSRSLPKTRLHFLITSFLGVRHEDIICEYGMSELSSQAYDTQMKTPDRYLRFPSWARVQIISPEMGTEVTDGETGLIRIFDLANVFSVAAIQTEDLGIRHGDRFELVGRAALSEPRGCSLQTA